MAKTTGGNKPRSGIIEAKLYSGRTSPSRKEWMGDCADMDAIGTKDPTAQHAKNYDNNVKRGWRTGDDVGGGGGAPGITDTKPYFDVSTARKGNAKPISTGGDNCERSPFSAAGKATASESDWSADYKPRNHK